MLTSDQPPALPLFSDASAAQVQPEPPLAVLVLGPPGSGKGTQAALLSAAWGFPHVSTGHLLRQRALVADGFGKQIADRIDNGQFVPDEWINRLLDERMRLPDCRRGLILDGYPRTLPQAERFWEASETAGCRLLTIQLKVSVADLAARFAGRRQCAVCGALFHLQFQPSLAGDRCDRPRCDGVLEIRQDDRQEFLERRLADFDALTAPVIGFLKARCRSMAVVDANGAPPDEVHARLLAQVAASENGESRKGNADGYTR